MERQAYPYNNKYVSNKEWILSNISFSYPGRTIRALKDISFNIESGEKVAIIGLNGAGKTTLVKLMLRLLEPDQGTIKFRGTDLVDWDIATLREQFGVVFQDFSRFKLTLYENIALATKAPLSSEVTKDAVFKAAKLTGIDEIVKATPGGYSTQLGTEFLNGIDISGGQWQKIALARAFVRDASVIILDEPTASLDAKTEKAILEQFLSLAQDKTAVLISHRLSITPMVDRILVLENGHLIEAGTHNRLIELNGRYAHMYKTQARMYWQ